MCHCVIVQVVPDILRCVTVSLCKWFLTFWDVSLCHCASGPLHFEMCHHVIVQVVPYILRWSVTVSLCKWFLTFWDGHCITVQVVPDIFRWSLCHCASGSLHFEMVTVSLCKWFLTFWDVSLCHCANGSWHFEMCHCASGVKWFLHLVRLQASLSGSSSVLPWWRRCEEPSKCQKPLSQWHSTTFQKTCTLIVMYLWVPYKMGKFSTSWATVTFSKVTVVLTV